MVMDWPALLVIFLIVLVLFGGKRLPGLRKAIGQSISGFKSGLKGNAPEKPPAPESEAQATPAEVPVVMTTALPASPRETTAQPPAPGPPDD
jgi:TatA/E family protein of Tat protein translocase